MKCVYEKDKKRTAYYDGDTLIGECDYEIKEKHWIITHTFVEKEYGGRGLARKLVTTLIDEARKVNVKVEPACSYAKKVMQDSSYNDVRL